MFPDSVSLLQAYRSAKASNQPLPFLTDSDVMERHHRFLRDSSDSEEAPEAAQAVEVYKQLYKEYCLADLSQYLTGAVGLRWRTEEEVVSGKGVERCGNLRCESEHKLRPMEVNFGYVEAGEKKNALVKVSLCKKCRHKLRKARKVKRQTEENERYP